MLINIYQIDPTKDKNKLLFQSYYSLLEKGFLQPDCNIYDKVYCGHTEGRDLEDVFEEFNIRLPKCFFGHSLSISDVVEVVEGFGNTQKGFYYCDTVGFVKLEPNWKKYNEINDAILNEIKNVPYVKKVQFDKNDDVISLIVIYENPSKRNISKKYDLVCRNLACRKIEFILNQYNITYEFDYEYERCFEDRILYNIVI